MCCCSLMMQEPFSPMSNKHHKVTSKLDQLYCSHIYPNLILKGKAGDILHFSSCQQIPWKGLNNKRTDPTHKYCLCILIYRLPLYHRALLLSITNTSMGSTVALDDMLLHYHKHRHCSVFLLYPTYTILFVGHFKILKSSWKNLLGAESHTHRVERSESIEKWTNTVLVLVGVVDNGENVE